MQITKESIIGDILDMDRTTAPFFLEMGMHCLGCPSARGESLEQACMVHGVDCDELLKRSTRIWRASKNSQGGVTVAVTPFLLWSQYDQ